MTTWEKRYARAIEKIGGAQALLALPKEVQGILKRYRTLKSKTQALELVAQNMDLMRNWPKGSICERWESEMQSTVIREISEEK